MQTTAKAAIPTDINKLKRDWWEFRCHLREIAAENTDLKRRMIAYDKVITLTDGLLYEMNSAQPEKGLLENIKKRLEVALLYAIDDGKIISREVRRKAGAGGGGIG
jgi:hypothetical protein